MSEPRVLTVEELDALPSDDEYTAPVCIESKYPVNDWTGGTHCKWCGAAFVKEEYLTDNKFYNADTYGVIWRAWTDWPTTAQRKAVTWG